MSRDLRLPPGQAKTAKFPVVGEKAPPPAALDLSNWRLEIGGLVEEPRVFTYAELLALPQQERPVDIHCVTGWTQFDMSFTGLPLAELLALARPRPEARFVSFEAYSPRRHDTSLPLELALVDTWLVHSQGGQPLAPEHGWPLRTLTPSRYFYKSLKWVHRIELLAEDRLGFWERDSSYHNVGDPWTGDQRFTTGSLKPAEAERFKNAEDFRPWRGKVLLGLDLRGWQPKSDDLSDLQLKNCNLDGAFFPGKNLSGANLSLSSLRRAKLGGATLAGADLEGACFAGADLRGANLNGSALSATRFFEELASGKILAAEIRGLTYEGASGLLEEQESFLEQGTGRPLPSPAKAESPVESPAPMFKKLLNSFGVGPAKRYTSIVSGVESLGHALQRSMTASSAGKNFVVSPASIGLALLLLRFGARGQTRENLNQRLGLTSYESESDLAEAARSLIATLGSAPEERLIAVANSLWANQHRLEFHSEYVEICQRALQAETRSLDLDRIEGIQEINTWVTKHTANRVKDLLDGSCLRVDAVLVNALVFKGSWQTPFKKAATKPRPFLREDGTRQDVPTLAGEVGVKLWQEGGRQWVVIPFCGEAEMRILLPAPGESLAAATAGLGTSNSNIQGAFFEGRVKLEMPRFRVDFKGELKKVLGELGFVLDRANFSGLAEGLLILTKVIHQAAVEVDEDGALGVAATAIALERCAPPPPVVREVRIDRPFYFQLRESISGLVLFSGLIYDPSGS